VKLPFDTVCIKIDENHESRMAPQAFAKMPIGTRVSVIIEKRISFYADGLIVDTRQALNDWRKWMVAEAAARHG